MKRTIITVTVVLMLCAVTLGHYSIAQDAPAEIITDARAQELLVKQQVIAQFDAGVLINPEQGGSDDWSELDVIMAQGLVEDALARANDARTREILQAFFNKNVTVTAEVDADVMRLAVTAIESKTLGEDDTKVLQSYLYDRVLGILDEEFCEEIYNAMELPYKKMPD